MNEKIAEPNTHRVFDDRTKVNLYEGSFLNCTSFAIDNFPEGHESFRNIWVGRIEEGEGK